MYNYEIRSEIAFVLLYHVNMKGWKGGMGIFVECIFPFENYLLRLIRLFKANIGRYNGVI